MKLISKLFALCVLGLGNVYTGLVFAAEQPANVAGAVQPVISEAFIAVEEISPLSVDGHGGLAFLRKPPGNGPFPAVILVHGGAPGWDRETLRDYAVHTHASRFLEAGYVVVAITRRELDLNLAAGSDQKPVLDALAVYDYVADLPYVDPQSITVRGTSVGGYLTLEVAAARSPAAILVEEPFSFPFVDLRPGVADQSPDTGKLVRITAPILLVRGDQTPNINDFNREVFIPAVQAAGKSIAILTYPGELHSFAFYDSAERTLRPEVSQEAFSAMDAFFRQYIKTQPLALDPSMVAHNQIKN